MWGRGAGRDSQPSPTPGEGRITHEYRVIPTNYIYMLYIKRQKDQRDAERHNEVGGRGHSFTSSFIIPQGFQKHLLCTRMVAGQET